MIFGAVLVFIQVLIRFEGLATCQHYLIICCFGVFVWFLGEMRDSFAVDIGCCQQPGCTSTDTKKIKPKIPEGIERHTT